MEILHKDQTFNIIGACMRVHSELGCGFLEAVYQEALAFEFDDRGIIFKKEEQIEVYYKQHTLKQYYQADFICYDNIIVELKAAESLSANHTSQLINYLNATDCRVGLLINFGAQSLEHKRIVV